MKWWALEGSKQGYFEMNDNGAYTKGGESSACGVILRNLKRERMCRFLFNIKSNKSHNAELWDVLQSEKEL